jgi:CRP/FNR family transcriptional regulator, anaerobic regulatory protein
MDWIEAFPSLRDLSEDTRCRLLADCSIIELSQGSRIFGPGQAPENFLMLLDGLIRVQQVAANGREIVLYRVAAGETCALTTACLLGYEDYQAEAIAETDIRAAVIRRGSFDELIASSSEFRRFVFTTFSLRVTSIFRLIEEVIFSRQLGVRGAEFRQHGIDNECELFPGMGGISQRLVTPSHRRPV